MFVARQKEQELLRATLDADSSQFIAIYGRRRVGKTLLVREAFGYSFVFQHAGLAKGDMSEQISAFSDSLKDAGLRGFKEPSSWLEAFSLLKELIRQSGDARKVVFVDELSWMDTPVSGMLTALEHFWNGWASARRDVVLVVCASATSWMLDNVIHNKGGLYNRLTRQIHLQPFTLGECEQFAEAKGLALSRHQLIEAYMALGGVAYYWDQLEHGLSLPQCVDALFYAKGAPLAREYDYLFASLFRYPEAYVAIVEALARRGRGMTRDEVALAAGLANSGTLTKRLSELESCGFIRRYRSYGKKAKGSLYQLIDNFTLFHHKFLANGTGSGDERYWSNLTSTPAKNAWCGIAFERVCLEHVVQIKAALGVAGVQANVCAWSCKRDEELGIHGSRIDLLIDRRDQVINVCEMKYSADDYAPTRADDEAMRHKLSDFRTLAGTRSALHPTLVTPYGLQRNLHAGTFQAVVTGDDLFG